MKDDDKEKSGTIDFDISALANSGSAELIMPKMALSGFGYQSLPLPVETREQARHRGFIRVHQLVDAMAECDGWDQALPRAYRLLCCERLPGAPATTENSDRRSIWYRIMGSLLSDTQVDWSAIDPPVVPPPGLKPNEYADGCFMEADRKPGYEFVRQFIRLDEFRDYVGKMEAALELSLPLPEDLFQEKPQPSASPCKPGFTKPNVPTKSQAIREVVLAQAGEIKKKHPEYTSLRVAQALKRIYGDKVPSVATLQTKWLRGKLLFRIGRPPKP